MEMIPAKVEGYVHEHSLPVLHSSGSHNFCSPFPPICMLKTFPSISTSFLSGESATEGSLTDYSHGPDVYFLSLQISLNPDSLDLHTEDYCFLSL